MYSNVPVSPQYWIICMFEQYEHMLVLPDTGT